MKAVDLSQWQPEKCVTIKFGALIVMDYGTLTGIFTERDFMNLVVVEGLDPDKVQVSEAMTSLIATEPLGTPISEAANIMS